MTDSALLLAKRLLELHATVPEDPDVQNVKFEEMALSLARAVIGASQKPAKKRKE